MSYQIEGAVIKEQGVSFAIVMVKHDVVENITENQAALDAYSYVFEGMPIILMGHDSQGKSNYYGSEDIVYLLAKVDPHSIPWRRYIINH
ncbi:hypothetical protein DP73_03040 [Desulfosporosinus sp. HMP52]|uniref:hypothetical protein n=1 Tax=Desulfosporosinus sp. HMP52 TaxID=1487923 RepID=UPI00051F9FFC|nr:hypothetical protein [Desulfosporosinus sp. HMP52]KGK91565.1 hypothetical protein DP73_03040 [Desulfosporosinus sp. HMP52]